MSKKRRIVIPDPVFLVNPDQTPVVLDGKQVVRAFRFFVFERTMDMAFVSADKDAKPETHPYDQQVLFDQMECLKMAEREPGSTRYLDEGPYQRLARAVSRCSYNPAVAYLFIDHILAIQNAPLVEPEEEKLLPAAPASARAS